MPEVLVRDVDATTLRRLKARAEEHGRSLQNELKHVLLEASRSTPAEMRTAVERVRRSLRGRRFRGSAELIREDRKR